MMCTADIDPHGPGGVWIYRPRTHKNAWRGHARQVPLVPKTQKLLAPFLNLSPEAFLFSPTKSEEERRVIRRAARGSKLTPSQRERDRRNREGPRRVLAKQWTSTTYRHAIQRACKKASVPRWSPGRLRHSFQDQAERLVGLEGSAKALGHHHIATVEHYRNRRDLATAVEVMTAVARSIA